LALSVARAAESLPFAIDTNVTVAEPLSLAFSIDTRGATVSGPVLSASFEIDTQDPQGGSLADLSVMFTIDTRPESEKLDYKYQLWAAANTPSGQRGMEDVTERFGISNLLAFSMGWEADAPSTWFQAGIYAVEFTGAQSGVRLRAHRRTDLPELTWLWCQSGVMSSFTNTPTPLTNTQSSLGGVMEQWDIRVPLPSPPYQEKSFYRLEVTYPAP
jgi:hypothetical protein